MSPWKITWRLKNYMVNPGRPVHLDGILHALCPADPDLSFIEKETVGDQWCHKASALRFVPPYVHSTETLFLRSDPLDSVRAHLMGVAPRKSDKVDGSSDRDASRMYATHLVWPHRIEAHVIADRTRLEAALADLDAIGGDRRLGFGEIRSCDIEPGDPEGWRFRVTSWPVTESIRLIDRAHPPYYQRSARMPVYAPIEMMMNGAAV